MHCAAGWYPMWTDGQFCWLRWQTYCLQSPLHGEACLQLTWVLSFSFESEVRQHVEVTLKGKGMLWCWLLQAPTYGGEGPASWLTGLGR